MTLVQLVYFFCSDVLLPKNFVPYASLKMPEPDVYSAHRGMFPRRDDTSWNVFGVLNKRTTDNITNGHKHRDTRPW